MADVRHGSRADEDAVTINAEFVRRQAQAAVRQFFRPVIAAFESHPFDPKSSSASKETFLPKQPRVEYRGYAIKKRRSR